MTARVGLLEALDTTTRLQRRLRVIAILDGARRAGLTPLPLRELHNIAYFADALAPVWGIRILDARLLKRREGPISPVVQHDVDVLVGQGVVVATRLVHRLLDETTWALDADFDLNRVFAERVLKAAEVFDGHASHIAFVRELVQAMSALGSTGIEVAAESDAAWGDRMIDFGSLVDIEGTGDDVNLSARVALRFGSLLRDEVELSSAEMLHLYVRELHKRMTNVA